MTSQAVGRAPLLRLALAEVDRRTALSELQSIVSLLRESCRVEEQVFRSASEATRLLRATFATLMPFLSDAEAEFPELVEQFVADLAALEKVDRTEDCSR